MKLDPWMQSLLTFLVRRGLTLIGGAAAQVSDEWVTQTVGLLVVGGNELFQWWQAYKKGQQKAETVKIGP